MPDCLFCQLIGGNQLKPVYQDEQVMAIRDIDPKAKVHCLIIPKRHIDSINQLHASDESLAGHLLMVAQKLAKQGAIDQTGYRLVVNTNQHAGQSVPHLHLHLLGGEPLGAMNTLE